VLFIFQRSHGLQKVCFISRLFSFVAAVSPLLLHGSAWGDLSLGVCEMLYRKEHRRLNKGGRKLVIEAKKEKGLLRGGASGLEVWLAFGEMGRSALGMTKIDI